MEIRQLELLSSAVELGSLTAAAKRGHLSQPAMSQQIHALEEELGEALLIRKPRGVEATAAGKILLKHASLIIKEVRLAKLAFSDRQELQSGKVVFGMIPTIAPYLLPRLVSPFREKFPNIELEVLETKTHQLVEKVALGILDFAILSDVNEAELKRSSLSLRKLFDEPLLLAAPPKHPLIVQEKAPSPHDIAENELIHLAEGNCLAEQTLALCRTSQSKHSLQCDQLATALAMVVAGFGVTLVPKLGAQMAAHNQICLREFGGKSAFRTVYLLTRKEVKLNAAAESLLKTL